MVKVADLAILKAEIEDKKKASTAAKLLVIVQASWMLVNCLWRTIKGLPITLIELNVVLHVICAMLLYGFWWNKPHDIVQPISLSPKIIPEGLCAMIYVGTRSELKLRASQTLPGPAEPPSDPHIFPDAAEPWCWERIPENKSGLSIHGQLPEFTNDLDTFINMARKEDGIVMLFKDQVLVNRDEGFTITNRGDIPKHLTQWDLKTFAAAAQELREPRFPLFKYTSDGAYNLEAAMLETGNSRPSPFGDILSKVGYEVLMFSPLYAAAHAGAWNSRFPTTIERWLWRVSCILVMAPSLAFGLAKLWDYIDRPLLVLVRPLSMFNAPLISLYAAVHGGMWNIQPPTTLTTNDRWFWRILRSLDVSLGLGIMQPLMRLFPTSNISAVLPTVIDLLGLLRKSLNYKRVRFCFTSLYILAIFYIIFECFLSIRRLPKGAFETVAWQEFPHL